MSDKPDTGSFRRSSFIAGLVLVGSGSASLIIAMCLAIAVVVVLFSNTRADGLAAGLVVFLSLGVLTNPIIFGSIMARRGTHWPWTSLAIVPWLSLAVLQTRLVCKGSFINWSNWRWILASGDQRSYELTWIILGWIATILSATVGLVIARFIARTTGHVKVPIESRSQSI